MDLFGGPPVTNTNTGVNLNQNDDLNLLGDFGNSAPMNDQANSNNNGFDILGGGSSNTHFINPPSTMLCNDNLSMLQLNGRVEFSDGKYYIDLKLNFASGMFSNNVMINIDPNYFGFNIKNNMMVNSVMLTQNNGNIRLELERNVNKSNNPQEILLNENSLICKLGMSGTSNVVQFSVKYPMTFILDAKNVEVNDFKQGWVKIPQSNELSFESMLPQQNSSQNFFEQRMSANFFTHIKSTQNSEGNMLHYFAARMIDENLILLELKRNPNGSHSILVKSD